MFAYFSPFFQLELIMFRSFINTSRTETFVYFHKLFCSSINKLVQKSPTCQLRIIYCTVHATFECFVVYCIQQHRETHLDAAWAATLPY